MIRSAGCTALVQRGWSFHPPSVIIAPLPASPFATITSRTSSVRRKLTRVASGGSSAGIFPAVRVNGQEIEIVPGAGGVHLFQILEIAHRVRQSRGAPASGGERAGENLDVRVGFLGCRIHRLEHAGVSFGIDRPVSPLEGEVRFVPDDNVPDAPLEMFGKGADELGKVDIVRLIQIAAYHRFFGDGPTPGTNPRRATRVIPCRRAWSTTKSAWSQSNRPSSFSI